MRPRIAGCATRVELRAEAEALLAEATARCLEAEGDPEQARQAAAVFVECVRVEELTRPSGRTKSGPTTGRRR